MSSIDFECLYLNILFKIIRSLSTTAISLGSSLSYILGVKYTSLPSVFLITIIELKVTFFLYFSINEVSSKITNLSKSFWILSGFAFIVF